MEQRNPHRPDAPPAGPVARCRPGPFGRYGLLLLAAAVLGTAGVGPGTAAEPRPALGAPVFQQGPTRTPPETTLPPPHLVLPGCPALPGCPPGPGAGGAPV